MIGGLLQTSLGFKCFLCTSHDLYGAGWILNGFPLISMDFYGCLFRSVDFYVLQTSFPCPWGYHDRFSKKAPFTSIDSVIVFCFSVDFY